MNEKDAVIHNVGKVSGYLLEHLDPVIRHNTEIIIARLMGMYRSGERSEGAYINLVGEMVALDNLQNTLKGRVNQSRTLFEKREREVNANSGERS